MVPGMASATVLPWMSGKSTADEMGSCTFSTPFPFGAIGPPSEYHPWDFSHQWNQDEPRVLLERASMFPWWTPALCWTWKRKSWRERTQQGRRLLLLVFLCHPLKRSMTHHELMTHDVILGFFNSPVGFGFYSGILCFGRGQPSPYINDWMLFYIKVLRQSPNLSPRCPCVLTKAVGNQGHIKLGLTSRLLSSPGRPFIHGGLRMGIFVDLPQAHLDRAGGTGGHAKWQSEWPHCLSMQLQA